MGRTINTSKICAILLAAGLAVAAPTNSALAGPPFVTDDPEPVDYQHFEINLAALGTLARHTQGGAVPSADINYGLLPEVQFHLGLAMPFQGGDGQTVHYGYGDTEIGVKLRFVSEDEAGWRPQIALYPNVELPTGSAKDDLGSGYTRVFLPLWLQKSFGAWTAYGGGGYWLNDHGDNRDYWFAGGLIERKLRDDLTLGGEVFEQGKDSVASKVSAGFNLGGTYDIDETHHLLFSAGRGIRDAEATNRFSYYLGDQLTF